MKSAIVIGGGIVGLATAWRITQKFPGTQVTVLEKEPAIALHQTGRNSGVIHSGIYYKPGSLKATNCREGKRQLEEFCGLYDIPFDRCGKVVVATTADQQPALDRIAERGRANGVECHPISRERLAELEPHCEAVAALHVPETGIVDYTAVCHRLATLVEDAEGQVVTDAEVTAIAERRGEVVVRSRVGEHVADFAVNCGGLYCDHIARLAGVRPEVRIVPFRGEYFTLKPAATHLVRNLIYPTPDPAFPFLGVHFTRMIGGGIECGPNAVLAFAREGYTRWTLNPRELAGTLAFGGFRTLAIKYWRTGLGEMWRSYSKSAFVAALQHLVPEIRADHLEAAPAGVRAQAVRSSGELVDDFLLQPAGRMLHVLNAPSPAATASLRIGQTIVDTMAEQLS
jgi:L-2-hydroxyglutarate oxidase